MIYLKNFLKSYKLDNFYFLYKRVVYLLKKIKKISKINGKIDIKVKRKVHKLTAIYLFSPIKSQKIENVLFKFVGKR